MINIQKEIDDRANLTKSNRFELLLFRLGSSLQEQTSVLFGINVFKLREIVPMPAITQPAGIKSPLLGMVNVRDQVIPVIDLPALVGYQPETGLNILLITEYARSVQAFAVESVDNIIRLDWQQIHTAEKSINGRYITSIANLDDDKGSNNLALVLDVEQILYDIAPSNYNQIPTEIKPHQFNLLPGAVAIVAEDSRVAREILGKGLSDMNIPYIMHATGKDAWDKIKQLAKCSETEGMPVSEKIAMVLTDLEMPEMDGFTLTLNIKADKNLKNIPVIIHSSLSGSANEEHVRQVKADGYVAKFEINELSSVIYEVMERASLNLEGPLICGNNQL